MERRERPVPPRPPKPRDQRPPGGNPSRPLDDPRRGIPTKGGAGYDILAREAGRPVQTTAVHSCKLPGKLGRWWHRLREGAEVRCHTCGLVFVLRPSLINRAVLHWELHPGYTAEP